MINISKEVTANSIQKDLGEKYYLYPKSLRDQGNLAYFLVRDLDTKYLGVIGSIEDIENSEFTGVIGRNIIPEGKDKIIRLYHKSGENLKKLISIFPSLKPSLLGQKASFGFGDRLGMATPAHTRVINKNKCILPVFAQQSVRELAKTNRTFQDVVDSAMWGIFQEGYEGKWGADADHIKSKEYFVKAVEQGMTMFTLDSSDVLEEQILNMDANQIKDKFDLNSKYLVRVRDRYIGKIHKIGDYTLRFDENATIRIALTYKKVLDFIEEIFKFLKEKISYFDYEVSLDETNAITSPEAHYFIVNEMQHRGVIFSGLALKFPGTFEKGIDYNGDVFEFEKNIKVHSEISRSIGGYKLSLHSGSDKFTIYPAFNKYTEGVFHIKTSGTSWLEALGVIAIYDPDLFRELYNIAVDTFKKNKKDYNISIIHSDFPNNIDNIRDEELGDLLYDKNIRRVFHISYGPILEKKKREFFKVIFSNEEKYYKFLTNHLEKHFDALNK